MKNFLYYIIIYAGMCIGLRFEGIHSIFDWIVQMFCIMPAFYLYAVGFWKVSNEELPAPQEEINK